VAELKGTKTENNLFRSLLLENLRQTEGTSPLPNRLKKRAIRRLQNFFRAAAEAETVHAHAHLRVLGGVTSTAENLKEAISGETHEFTEMYPAMIDGAIEDGSKAAERSFTYANKVEKVHAALYQKASDNLDTLEEVDYYVCSVCGFTCENEPPEACPVCGAKSSAFFKTE